MNALFIAEMFATVAKTLHTRLSGELTTGNVPGETLLIRAIERLVASKLISWDNEAEFLDALSPTVVHLLLKNIVSRTSSNPQGELTRDAIQLLLKTCLGTPTGDGTVAPDNRKKLDTIPPKGGAHDYVYFIDQSSIPGIPNLTKKDFLDVVQSAWILWERKAPNLKIKATKRVGNSNMQIRFTQLDGIGSKLAEATLRQPGTSEFRMDIDVAESWNASKLLGTVLHELGHVLGIDHISTPGSIMYFQADSNIGRRKFENIDLTPADIAVIPPIWSQRTA